MSARSWTTRDGMPDDRVLSIAQDVRGYLYIATYSGVVQFDGVRFVPVAAPELPTAGRARARVLVASAGGGLWAALSRGPVVHWAGTKGEIYGDEVGMPDRLPFSLCEDDKGGVLVGFMAGGMVRIADGKVTPFTGQDAPRRGDRVIVCRDGRGQIWCSDQQTLWQYHDGTFTRAAEVDGLNTLAALAEGGVWVGELTRLRKFIPGRGYVAEVAVPTTAGQINVVHEDMSGTLWVGTRIGTDGGLFRLDGDALVRVPIPETEINAITHDREGNVWVGSLDRGIKRLQPRQMRVLSHAPERAHDHIIGFAFDVEGRPWIAQRGGGVIYHHAGEWTPLAPFQNNGRIRATSITGAAGSILIGTAASGAYRWDNRVLTALPHSHRGAQVLLALVPLAGGDVLLSYADGRIRRLRGESLTEWQLPEKTNSRTLGRAEDGFIYVAAGGGRLFRFDLEKPGTVEELPLAESGRYALRPLLPDETGGFWLGFGSGGLGRWKDGRLMRITTEHGLLDNNVSQLVKDGDGMLWIASNRGVSRLDPADFEAYAAGREPRLRIVQYPTGPDLDLSLGSQHTALRAREGELWFSTQTSLLIVNPRLRQPRRAGASMMVEAARVDGRSVAPEFAGVPPLDLPPDHTKVEIEYSLPSFSSPENVEYRVWMEGFDTGWNHVGKLRQATYSRLSAGDYRFRVAGRALDGEWIEAAPLAVSVSPFLWQTWPFRLALIAGGLGATVLVTRRAMQNRLRRKQEELEREQQWSRERARIARDMHDDLGSSLIHLALLGDMAGDDQAEAMERKRNAGKIAEMARHLAKRLHEVVWSINPEHDTLGSVATYLGQYTSDLLRAAGIVCVLDIPTALPQATLSSSTRHHVLLAAREALNNIIRHSRATEVSLSMQVGATQFVVVLQDNGVGFDPAVGRPGGNGLGNMRHRLELAGGSCTFARVAPTGMRIVFTVPLGASPSP